VYSGRILRLLYISYGLYFPIHYFLSVSLSPSPSQADRARRQSKRFTLVPMLWANTAHRGRPGSREAAKLRHLVRAGRLRANPAECTNMARFSCVQMPKAALV